MRMTRLGAVPARLVLCLFFTSPVSADQATSLNTWRAAAFGYGQGLAVGTLINGKARLIKTEPNRHDPATVDRIESISIPGIRLEVRRVPVSQDWPLLERLVITRDGFPLVHDLRVGTSTQEAVERILGKPDQRKGLDIAYVGLNEMCEDLLHFRFRGGKLLAAEWEWCSD